MTGLREDRHRADVTCRCAHCGLPVPVQPSEVRSPKSEVGTMTSDFGPRTSDLGRRTSDEKHFCCAGCRQVYTLLHEWGFGEYYHLIDRQGRSVEPARVTGRTFTDFDDAHVQAEATEPVGERRRTRLYLENVHCAACVWLVEKLPVVLRGLDEVRLNLGTSVAEVTWRPADTRLSTIARALDRLGYTPHVHRASQTQEARRREDRAGLARLGVAAACAMNLMFLHGALYAGDYSGMAAPFATFFRWLSLVVAIPVLVYSARPFFRTALAGLAARIVHIDLPIAIALTVAFLASAWNTVRGTGPLWFDSLAMLVAALLGARQLQRGAQRVALERADSLRAVAFLEFARRLEGDGADAPSVEVPLAGLSPGDRVEIRSGETVPVDGIVLSGRSSLDNAVLTGEAAAVAVREGDVVNAGATNLGARLVVSVHAVGERTRVGALLTIVRESLSKKPALLRATDAMARRFVQALFIVAAATGIAWMGSGPQVALERVVALLVVACPCALGLSVPLALAVALMRAARWGIFVKDPDALERVRGVHTVVLDKTGTLTEGRRTVVRWQGDDLALELAGALEAESAHSVARAFQRSFARPVRLLRTVEEVVEVRGQGIAGRIDGRVVHAGNRAFVEAAGDGVCHDLDEAEATFLADGLSPVFVALDGRVRGVAGVGDALRPDAAKTVAALRKRGICVKVLSGDHPEVVARVGRELGLADGEAVGGLTPEAKRDIVAQLSTRNATGGTGPRGAVVMVGDGVNDAAALALADVGIAVHGGAGATIVAADVVLTREGVAPILDVLDGARRLRGVVRRNLAFSLFYNAVASALAVAGLVGPLAAAIMMPVSSLTVVLSSALTRTFAGPTRRSRGPAPFDLRVGRTRLAQGTAAPGGPAVEA